MKFAPNVKQLPKDKLTEAIIFAGSDAFAHAQHWIESEGKKHGDNIPPVYLGKKQLAELGNLRIIDKGRQSARVYLAGEIEPIQINAIGEKLALAGVQEAKLYKGIPDREPENWREYLARVREQADRGESLVEDMRKAIGNHAPADELAPRVESRAGGLYWVTPKIDKQSGEVIRPGEWLSDQMRTVGIGNDGGEAYLIIEMVPEGADKIIHEAMPRNEIGMPAGWSRLRGRGVAITTSAHLLNKLAEYLQRQGERTVWEVTSTAGWHCGAYVMPDGEVIGTADRPVAFCGGSAAIRGYVVRGTTNEWRDKVASLMRGNHSMMLGALVGLAAPLNSLAGGSCFGIHLFAQSSAGKTTTVEAATSLYGDPEMLKLSWDATRHGLTVEAAARNDGFIPIDEIGQGGKVTEIAQSAYSLFNGVGRIQGRKEGGNRAVMRWKIAALSTGEEDFETFLLKGGITPKAGQLVRLLSVPFIDTIDFNGYDDGDEHARAIKRLSSGYCGAAGREWIRWLAENKDKAINIATEKENLWLTRLPEGASSQVRRVASRFAMLDAAGVLSGAITGWTAEECQSATQQAFDDWLQDFGLENREKYQVVSRARDFIQRHALSRFQPYTFGKSNGDMDGHYAARISNLAGYLVNGRREDGQQEYHIIPSVFDEEILCGISRNFGCKTLEDAGMLVCAESGRWTSKTVKVNGTQQRFIVLTDQPEE
ncbi:Superfamily II helicase and inactivated derivatives [Serratia plymuthica]|nr:Superfamily II helicase and inactivated derivatives [Serratia plymuthica]